MHRRHEPKVVEDGALRRPRPRRAGGTYAVQRPTTLVAPLNARCTAQRAVLYHHGSWEDQNYCDISAKVNVEAV